MQVTKEGSVRVDLVGGTLDLEPIHLILKNVVTLNVATSLKAQVTLDSTKEDFIEIESLDYKTNYKFKASEFTYENLYESDHFGPMKFVCQILDFFKVNKELKLTMSSGAPAGSGLGGSSAMGVTLFNALSEYFKKPFLKTQIIKSVKDIESRILNQGIAGYQDYHPALYGGVLGLVPSTGELQVEQLYTPELKKYLESHISLIFSGKSRLSGMNNWEMYKSFFDKDAVIRKGLQEIARVSYETYQNIKQESYQNIANLIGKEGECRAKLFPGIYSKEMSEFHVTMKKKLPNAGMKVCGAGGGGCFIVTHQDDQRDEVDSLIDEFKMQRLEFCIEKPIE